MKSSRKESRLVKPMVVLSTMFTQADEMKIQHIRSAIDAQRKVMLQIIVKNGGPTTFLASNAAKSINQ